jgi:Plasma-membrane choline transporter
MSDIDSPSDFLYKIVYVGLYGFNYIEAGRNVVQFFQHKGWTAIISDDLASNVLFMMSVAVGLASGLVGLVVSLADSNMFYNLGFDNSMEPAFMIGFFSGFLFASVILSVVGSGVNTVIVCYAEDPAAFQLNHPQLSTDMREAWVKAWPDLMH